MPQSRFAGPPAGADVQVLLTLNERLQTFQALLVPAGGRYELRDQQTGHVIAADIDLATFAETNPHLMTRPVIRYSSNLLIPPLGDP